MRRTCMVLLVFVFVCSMTLAMAQEKKTKGKVVLPESVLSAFHTAYPHAVIKGTSQETEKGMTYYEVESVDGKMKRDLLYTADGKAVEVEEAIFPGALPPAVLQALAKAYPNYKILKAEDLVKGDQKFFELQIQVKGKKIGVTINPSGKISEQSPGSTDSRTANRDGEAARRVHGISRAPIPVASNSSNSPLWVASQNAAEDLSMVMHSRSATRLPQKTLFGKLTLIERLRINDDFFYPNWTTARLDLTPERSPNVKVTLIN